MNCGTAESKFNFSVTELRRKLLHRLLKVDPAMHPLLLKKNLVPLSLQKSKSRQSLLQGKARGKFQKQNLNRNRKRKKIFIFPLRKKLDLNPELIQVQKYLILKLQKHHLQKMLGKRKMSKALRQNQESLSTQSS